MASALASGAGALGTVGMGTGTSLGMGVSMGIGMGMMKAKYEELVEFVKECLKSHHRPTVLDAIHFDVSLAVLSSLYRQIFVRQLKLELRQFTYGHKQQIIKRVQQGESLLSISREYQLGTYKLAMLYIQEVYGNDITLSAILHNPEIINNALVRSDILQMITIDASSAPEIDLLKECVGKEYEELLIDLLKKRMMCFETEVELRSKGKPKTPDILFLIPMAMQLSSTSNSNSISKCSNKSTFDPSECTIVNWIDSKAMFADYATVEEQLEQFRAYNNRYLLIECYIDMISINMHL
jgi:hypothetical protein